MTPMIASLLWRLMPTFGATFIGGLTTPRFHTVYATPYSARTDVFVADRVD